MTPERILEDLTLYRELERKLLEKISNSPAKSYSINSGGAGRQASTFDIAELEKVRKIIADLENKLENARCGSGTVIGAGW